MDARQPPHVLVFEIRAVAEPEDPRRKHEWLACCGAHRSSDVELGGQARVLRVPDKLAVREQLERRGHTCTSMSINCQTGAICDACGECVGRGVEARGGAVREKSWLSGVRPSKQTKVRRSVQSPGISMLVSYDLQQGTQHNVINDIVRVPGRCRSMRRSAV